jgi:hypothetical protein
VSPIHHVRGRDQSLDLDFASLDGVLLTSFTDWSAESAAHLKAIARSLHDRPRERMQELVDRFSRRPCPLCHEPVFKAATRCPHCQGAIPAEEETDPAPGNDPA